MERFKFFPHMADAEFDAYGKTLKEAFEHAALAMFEVMVNTAKVEPKVKRVFERRSEDIKSMLYDFLEELLYLHETQNLVFSKFEIKNLKRQDKEWYLKARAWGEEFDPSKHEPRNAIKAVTYHQMEVGRKDKLYFVHVILDL
jgi:SHS2 domain-containing protein